VFVVDSDAVLGTLALAPSGGRHKQFNLMTDLYPANEMPGFGPIISVSGFCGLASGPPKPVEKLVTSHRTCVQVKAEPKPNAEQAAAHPPPARSSSSSF
jgi:hypothetical protein